MGVDEALRLPLGLETLHLALASSDQKMREITHEHGCIVCQRDIRSAVRYFDATIMANNRSRFS